MTRLPASFSAPHTPIMGATPMSVGSARPSKCVLPNMLTHDYALPAVERLLTELITVSSGSSDEELPATMKAARYHLAAGGHRVRAKLALHGCRRLGVATEDAVVIAAAVELLHNASLVHDDLQDREKMRRGKPTVWAAFGQDVAICTGDILLSAAYGALAGVSETRLVPLLLRRVHERTAMVIQGQCRELSSKDRAATSLEKYESIVTGKSGALLSLPLELAFLAARREGSVACVQEAAHAFGIGYQMVDDIEDFEADTDGQNLNIILLLQASGEGEGAFRLARNLALERLEHAERLANSLPEGTGLLLSYFARALSERLRANLS